MSADVQSMPNGFPLGDAPGLTSPHRSDKDKSDKDRSKHKKSKKEKHRDRSKERKHKDKKKDKSKDKDRSEKKDKDKKKHKHDKDRDREKEKKKDKERDEKKKENNHHAGKNEVKEEVERGLSSSVVKEENNSNLDFSANSDYQRSPSPSSRPKKKAKYSDDEDEDEDEHYVGEDDEDEDYDEKPAASASKGKKRKGDDEDDDFKPASKKAKTDKKSAKKSSVKNEAPEPESPKKGRKKKEDEEEHQVWKWWEEEKKEDGVKWKFLEHKGPVFAPLYERLPPNVKFYYDGKEMKLSEEAEEVATFYAKMLTHDYTTKEAFNKNFFKDWRKFMTDKEKDIITDLSKCDFRKMNEYFTMKSEERKAMSKEEKKAIKEENEKILKEYGFCTIDGHKEKIGNFKVEPPSLFRGRGEHPKMGKVKRRIQPEDVIINCSKDSKIPVPPAGHKWKEIRHDNTVTWLCSWTENIQGQIKYIMLNPSSKLKGEKDWQKYETARKLHRIIDRIREDYWGDMKSKEMRIRQRAVAMYLIDKLALRAGNEKEEGETADTVGCCSLRYEHVSLHEHKNGKDHVVGFDFLGKDSIRYSNEVSVEKRVFKNLQLFMENKNPGDDLFDRLNTSILNKHLQSIMDGLTAKVFRTYNASRTLQEQLDKLTDPDDTPAGLILSYNRANRAVAILCNHQRAVPKSHAKSMENLQNKIQQKEEQIREAEKDLKGAKKDLKDSKSQRDKIVVEKKSKALERLREQLMKLNVQATDKEENKEIALGTSKLNYLDPRISVAWCKKYNVPIEKVYSKTHRMKFRWAIDMAGPDFVF